MDFAFLIHSRDYTDVQRKFKIAKYLPKSWIEFWCLHWPPVIVSKIDGVKNKEDNDIKGWLIGVPMTAKQMIEHRELAKKRIVQAINKAERLGAKIVGLGALTSSVTAGGQEIKDKINIDITPGHAYTTFTVSSYVIEAAKTIESPHDILTLGVVGAAGSVGSSCTQYLATKGFNKFILVDIERKTHRLQKLVQKLKRINSTIDIVVSHQINTIKNADLIIAATNAAEALIKPDDLKTGAVIIDDAQPSDISPEVIQEREDVLTIDGGIISTPNINCHFNMGLANKNDIFCCLGETIILASEMPLEKYSLGEIPNVLIEQIGEYGKKLGFKLSDFQRSSRIHPTDKLHKVKLSRKESEDKNTQ